MTEAKAREIAVAIYQSGRTVDSIDGIGQQDINRLVRIILSVPVDLAGDLALLSKEQAQQILQTIALQHPKSGWAQMMSEF